MAHLSDLDMLVRHDLRLRGFAEAGELARRRGLAEADVVSLLRAGEARGLVRHRPGAVGGWSLTEAGRAHDERALAGELDSTGSRQVVESAYRSFEGCNAEMLQLFTDWQLRPRRHGDGGGPTSHDRAPAAGEGPEGPAVVVNDHTDQAYDAAVLARLRVLDLEAAQPICAELAAVLDRFAGYGPRLAGARRRVESGELEWFDRLTVDSYHSVWFELHEDLLSTLGLQRESVSA